MKVLQFSPQWPGERKLVVEMDLRGTVKLYITHSYENIKLF